ncbi:MAG: efflux RND transporter periplasmic adaptor subunit [Paludibacterium sp.]|uniref:efflux RND transporter periplasmic adaptor subunit n=2 Tax=Paludibacterium sp. TaxID=1917523 RepID=UPI0025CDE5B5|nr:efflux RND transporter periplasmic adaptor subunit [Paludibacterium sp.]MBV8048009.1 efflux RND transporter periplasmic adaptor subunit [Paludibacterium sp.]
MVRHRPKAMLALIGIGSCVGALLFYWVTNGKDTPVLTVTVARGDLEQAVLASGVLKPIRQVDVGAQASGQLQRLHVQLGQRVAKGQLLAEIDPSLAQGKLQMAQADLDASLAERRGKLATLASADQEVSRQARLLAADATSEKGWLDAHHKRDELRASLAMLDAQIVKQRYQIGQARVELGYTRIVAPMAGEVLTRDTKEGQTVIAVQEVPKILSLGDLSRMEVQAQVSEADVLRVQPGQRAYFSLLGAPDARYFGTVSSIRPTPEKINNAMFYTVLFDVDNPERLLRVDMTVQVGVIQAEVKNGLLLPMSALGEQTADGRHRVKVLPGEGEPVERLVRIGLKGRTQAQVLDGLKEGERVVSTEVREDEGGVQFSVGG